MKIARIYSTEDGESRFDEVDLAFADLNYIEGASPIGVAGPFEADRVQFVRVPDGWTDTRHPSPSRQYVAVLDGEGEFTTSDGEVRIFRTGDIFLLDDTRGKGHGSRFTGKSGFLAMMTPLKP